jgi:hypothetical protein
MVVQKLFCIAFALFVEVHRIASHFFCIAFAFRICISHLHRTFCIFFTFLHFVYLYGRFFAIDSPRSCEKCTKMRKIWKKKKVKIRKRRKTVEKCEMQMRCENGVKIRIASHCTTVTENFRIFAFSFSPHSHHTTIPGPPRQFFLEIKPGLQGPVFWLLGHLRGVKPRISLRTTFFWLFSL